VFNKTEITWLDMIKEMFRNALRFSNQEVYGPVFFKKQASQEPVAQIGSNKIAAFSGTE